MSASTSNAKAGKRKVRRVEQNLLAFTSVRVLFLALSLPLFHGISKPLCHLRRRDLEFSYVKTAKTATTAPTRLTVSGLLLQIAMRATSSVSLATLFSVLASGQHPLQRHTLFTIWRCSAQPACFSPYLIIRPCIHSVSHLNTVLGQRTEQPIIHSIHLS